MKALVTLVLAALTFASVNAHARYWWEPASAPEQTMIPGATITEYDDSVIIMIEGYDVKSLKQLHSIIAQGLHLPSTYGANFDALYDVLTDPSVVSKRIDLTVISGEYLKQNIGAKNVRKLLDVMNDAQEADPMHMSAMYWQ
ncbi:barstar family protein [Bdellovibrio sp. NC01]|uniref:barstar family protein n=1 Tax=Bdellovibrio sp. NC01 TaxID=2220073 RepID=UPI00115855F1|nr:barstar family protein [Bdellovibrio sp. NC01]QDK38966.1 hypothetical protein DOE51_15915 [Bdellovibrio sp. NC01]